jgi:hypothetical protein
MRRTCFIFSFFISVFLFTPASFTFYTQGHVNVEFDYDKLEIYPPEIDCEEPVVKDDIYKTDCLAKIKTRLLYALTEDTEFKATLLFYTIFDEIVGEAKIEETLRWEENHIDIVDYVYIYPEFDFNALKSSHHVIWKVHENNKDTSTGK